MFDKQLNPDETQKSLDDLGPLYHSYRLLGVKNKQRPGIFQANQACKEPIILSYILLAAAIKKFLKFKKVRLVAEIKKNNFASTKSFTKNNFYFYDSKDQYNFYQRTLG